MDEVLEDIRLVDVLGRKLFLLPTTKNDFSHCTKCSDNGRPHPRKHSHGSESDSDSDCAIQEAAAAQVEANWVLAVAHEKVQRPSEAKDAMASQDMHRQGGNASQKRKLIRISLQLKRLRNTGSSLRRLGEKEEAWKMAQGVSAWVKCPSFGTDLLAGAG